MIESISKDKIPKQYGFVLKTEQLNFVLNENNINIHTDLIYCFSQPKYIGNIFEAFFWTPNENVPYNRLYIRAGVLQKENVFRARIEMKEVVFPEFVLWIKAIMNLPSNSPFYGEELIFEALYINDELQIKTYRR